MALINAFICEGLRTPIGRFGGALASVRTDDLAAIPIRALLEQNPAIDPGAIDEVILGCANQAGEDNRNVARMAALLAGLPASVPGSTVNRLCASGADAIGYAARSIMSGQIDFAIVGGVESMSRAPFVINKAETAWSRSASIEDTTIGWRFINPAMKKAYGVDSMPETAENVAVANSISRDEQDAFALRSQELAAKAQRRGFFADEISPVTVMAKKSTTIVSFDEHPRPDTTLESLSGLRPVVREDGTVTAGNASGVNDGAAAMFIASESAVKRHGLTPRARFLGMATAGVPPRVMGIGPAPASEKLMQRLGLGIDDFDLIELNEAFASQVIASLRMLHVDPFAEKVNPHGGAIALGHPLGMSGARLVLTAARTLQQSGGARALITMCIGVGQGLAIAIERV